MGVGFCIYIFVAYVQGLCPECVSVLPTSDDSAWQNSTRVLPCTVKKCGKPLVLLCQNLDAMLSS